MKRQVVRVVTGTNLVIGCLLLQGCGMFGKKGGDVPPPEPIPVDNGQIPAVVSDPAPVAVPIPDFTPPAVNDVQMNTPYSIRKGDTISGIAYRYHLRWQDIIALNPGLSPTHLRIGQIIQLPGQVDLTQPPPPPPPKTVRRPAPVKPAPAPAPKPAVTIYTVKSGDSLSLIAHRNKIKVADLKKANNLKSDRINVGQKLKIPGAAGAKGPAAATEPKSTPPKVTPPAVKKNDPKVKTPPAVKVEPKADPAKADAVTPPPPPPPVDEAKPAPDQGKHAEVTPPPAPNNDVAAAPDGKPSEMYTVKEGEDLYAIAIRWGITPSELRTLNNLQPGAELKPGMVLRIPAHAE